ncbi:MAG: molybdenum cofactor biosynthesis protein MoaE [Pseudomonadales bacterium]|nr:molybdenum cofactor biosynthesis protein MoaE [Pseudomonadales bacterium]MCP5185736.1 molybdenum cofactor biosynthesis protein MoaE [Pseudomonadales bacterium]
MRDDINPRVRIVVGETDFDPGAELTALQARAGGDVGAVATFIGLVRGGSPGEPVAALELEHYPGMTERSIETITGEAARRWPLSDVVIVHRVGRLAPGDRIVYVQVASGHRPAAFAACEFLMDYLKTEAVFWKRERRPSGDVWIESTADDAARRSRW